MNAKMISTGVANAASVEAAFLRAGVELDRATSPADVASAGALVVPGVGSFESGMAALASLGCTDALRERVAAGRPTLAVCLGMQLFASGSAEAPSVPGLGVLRAEATKLRARTVPHFGWNDVVKAPGCRALEDGQAYFAHSYALAVSALHELDPGWNVAACTEGETFAAAVERGPVLLCQFHPELSGAYGGALIRHWLELAKQESSLEVQTWS